MREERKKGNAAPTRSLPEPPHHLGVGIVVEAGLRIIVVAGGLIVLVGGDVGNSWGRQGGVTPLPAWFRAPQHPRAAGLLTVLAVGLLGSGAGGWWQGRAGMGGALELRFEHSR